MDIIERCKYELVSFGRLVAKGRQSSEELVKLQTEIKKSLLEHVSFQNLAAVMLAAREWNLAGLVPYSWLTDFENEVLQSLVLKVAMGNKLINKDTYLMK
mmetsp:Transcript_32998/g.53538  ORF Transcript_32998/g.53538 Transcript_32998/m.53538 type:complete len:100 (+) Transcript_32998:130-429(+)